MRKTKIVATVGPACESDKKLAALIRAGVDIFRINASHTSPQGIRAWMRLIRKAEKTVGRPVAALVDLQGPRVRTGKLADGQPLILKQGSPITIQITSKPGAGDIITTSCLEFSRMVKAGDKVLLDNGMMELEVLAVRKDRIACKVVAGGVLGENKGINLPNAPVTLPALGSKDHRDLQAAVASGVDYIALSFVRSAADVTTVKGWLTRRRKKIPVIAKIEKPRAVAEIDSILNVADGIMVARGDLGIEMGVEKVPFVQKELILRANRMRLPVITATQMLESMIQQPHPTRAEASDVANAVFDGTDTVMLSGETSVGKYPLEAVRMMAKIILDSEKHIGELPAQPSHENHSSGNRTINAIVHAARHAAQDLHARAIVVFTRSGKTAVLISKFRPVSPIVAFTNSQEVNRRLTLFWGIFPLQIRYLSNVDAMIREADRALSQWGIVKTDDPVVILSGRQAFPAARYMAKIHRIGDL